MARRGRHGVRGRRPDQGVHQRLVAGVRVGRTVLEAEQVAVLGLAELRDRVGPGERVLHPLEHQTGPGPAHHPAQRVHADVRLLALQRNQHVAVRPRRVEPVVGQERHRDQLPRLAVGQLVPVVEQRSADGDRGHQARIGHLLQHAAVRRRKRGVGVRRHPAGQQRVDLLGQPAECLAERQPVAVHAGERGQQAVRSRVLEDPDLVVPAEPARRGRVRLVRVRLAPGRGELDPAGGGPADDDRAERRCPQERPPGQRRPGAVVTHACSPLRTLRWRPGPWRGSRTARRADSASSPCPPP